MLALAQAEHEPVAVWCLFSGGNDSTVLAHRCREHYEGLAWIDTGNGGSRVSPSSSPSTPHGSVSRCGSLHAGDAYRQMVMGDLVWWAQVHRRARPASRACRSRRSSPGDEGEHTAGFGRRARPGASRVPRSGCSRPRVQPSEGTPDHGAAAREQERVIRAAPGSCSSRVSGAQSQAAAQSARRSVARPGRPRCSRAP